MTLTLNLTLSFPPTLYQKYHSTRDFYSKKMFNYFVCKKYSIFTTKSHMKNEIICYEEFFQGITCFETYPPIEPTPPPYFNHFPNNFFQDNFRNVSNKPREEKVWYQAVTHAEKLTIGFQKYYKQPCINHDTLMDMPQATLDVYRSNGII